LGPSVAAQAPAALALSEGTMSALPRQRFGVADVRDVADAHLKAAAMPDAAGKRYLLLADGPTITWLGLAEAIHDHLGAAGASVTLKEAPGDEPTPLTIHNDRAKQDLDWQPRAARTTITDTIDSLRQLGLLETR
jgi:nucleoside-diphosphate-sugar epimerase